jgi:hypothetical protein
MRTQALDIAGGRARWTTHGGDGATWLEWTHDGAPPAHIPFGHLRWSVDVLAGGDGPLWARSLPTIVERYDDAESWIFHASRLEPLHDLPCPTTGRWSVYRWAGQWMLDFHQQVACTGVSLPLLAALIAVLGCWPAAIR